MRWFHKTSASKPVPRTQGSLKEAGEPTDAPGDRRVIRTARTEENINEAARNGFRPLVKTVRPNPEVHCMLAVFQNSLTGEIEISGDFRFGPEEGGVMVINYTTYYPYHFPSPYAAYLIPPDLIAGEIVWLEDVIEDIVAVLGQSRLSTTLGGGSCPLDRNRLHDSVRSQS